jgi:hypothetical protein
MCPPAIFRALLAGLLHGAARGAAPIYMPRSPNVRMIDNPTRIVSAGPNATIRVAIGEVIVRTDAHTTYARNYVRESLVPHRRRF